MLLVIFKTFLCHAYTGDNTDNSCWCPNDDNDPTTKHNNINNNNDVEYNPSYDNDGGWYNWRQ